MNVADLLTDGLGRVREAVHDAVAGLTAAQLAQRLDEGELDRLAALASDAGSGRPRRRGRRDRADLDAGGWADRFKLPFPAWTTGYGQSAEEVAAVQVGSARLLTGYYDAVHEQTIGYVSGLRGADLDRVVDEAWTPPVTLGVRLVSVIAEDLQHAGQAAFIRGVLKRR